jgi:hypothetical protein
MTNKLQPWMIFRTEGNFVHYLWTGEYAILCYVPQGINPEAYYWTGIPARETPESERLQLDQIAENPRKRIFTLTTRTQQRFVVVSRGVFNVE